MTDKQAKKRLIKFHLITKNRKLKEALSVGIEAIDLKRELEELRKSNEPRMPREASKWYFCSWCMHLHLMEFTTCSNCGANHSWKWNNVNSEEVVHIHKHPIPHISD